MSGGSPALKSTPSLEWSPTFDIGVEEIDAAHRGLFAMANDVRDALERGDRASVRRRVETFVDAMEKHFAEEEQFLARVGYSGTEEHKAYHALVLGEARRLTEASDEDLDNASIDGCYADVLAFLLNDIVRADQQFKSYLDHIGLTR